MQEQTEKPLKVYSCFYKASMSPALGRSSVLQCVEVGGAFEIHNGWNTQWNIIQFLSGTAMYVFVSSAQTSPSKVQQDKGSHEYTSSSVRTWNLNFPWWLNKLPAHTSQRKVSIDKVKPTHASWPQPVFINSSVHIIKKFRCYEA